MPSCRQVIRIFLYRALEQTVQQTASRKTTQANSRIEIYTLVRGEQCDSLDGLHSWAPQSMSELTSESKRWGGSKENN